MLTVMSDEHSTDVQTLWDHHQKLALRGLLKLWQRFGDLEIWPDTGLRHIAQIYPYGVKRTVNFDMAFMMKRGYASFGALNDNRPGITQSAG